MGGRGALSTTGRRAIGKAVGALTGGKYKQSSNLLSMASEAAARMINAGNTADNQKVRKQYSKAKDAGLAKQLGLNERQRTLRVNKYENAVGEFNSAKRVLNNYASTLKKDSVPLPDVVKIALREKNQKLQPAPKVITQAEWNRR